MAFRMVSGILQAKMTGEGNAIDCAMVDGATAQLSLMFGLMQAGRWDDQQRGSNMVESHIIALMRVLTASMWQ